MILEPRGGSYRRSGMRRHLALALLLPALALGACSDDDGGVVDAGTGGPGEPAPGAVEPGATFEGTITQVTETEPVLDACVPADDLDPDGSVSSDDPPVCSDLDTLPQGSILVEVQPGVDGGEKIVFTILQDTALTRDGAPITFDDLAAGDEAKVGFSGEVAESYPGQASALAVDVTAG